MAKKVTKKSKKVVKKASKKKAVVKKAGKKKVSSVDYPTKAPSASREVYLPTGGTRKLAVNELTPSLEEELRSYANEEVRHQAELVTPEAPKPSLFQRILKFLKLGN